MTTPIRRRFDVVTEIKDKTAGKQTLSQPALIVEGAHTNGKRFNVVSPSDWQTVYPDENSVAYAWLETLFAQPNRPKSAVMIHKLITETVVEALNDAISLGAEWYWLCDSCNDDGQTVPDGTTTTNTPETSETLSLPGQSTKDVTVTIVPSVDGTLAGAGTEDNLEFTGLSTA